MVIDPSFLTKTQTLTFMPGNIFISKISSASSVKEDRKWCLVTVLKWYLHQTKDICPSDHLFILQRGPHSALSRDAILRCLTEVILLHAQGQVRAHKIQGEGAREIKSFVFCGAH